MFHMVQDNKVWSSSANGQFPFFVASSQLNYFIVFPRKILCIRV
jgi:hypothetical protein